MPPKEAPNPPDSLGKAGRKFWKQTLAAFELTEAHHLKLLENASLCLDRAAAARVEIEKAGIVTTNRFGEVREHPACNVERQSMQVFRQTVRELGFDIEHREVRGPARPGTRN